MLERMHDLGHKVSPCIVKFVFFQDNFAETMQEGSHVTRHQPPSTSTDVAFLRLDPCLDGGLKLCSHQVCLSPGSPRSSFFRGMRPLCLHSHAKVFRRFRQCLLVQGSRPLSQVIRQLVFRDGQEVSKSIAEGSNPRCCQNVLPTWGRRFSRVPVHCQVHTGTNKVCIHRCLTKKKNLEHHPRSKT